MKAISSLVVLTSFLFLGCSKNNNGDAARDTHQKVITDTGNEKKITKLGDLSLVKYASSACYAKVSGVDNPQQLLISYKCSWLQRSHTLSCSSDFLCSGTYGDENNKIEVGLSEDFKQLVVVWYNKNASIADSESFIVVE